MKNLITLNLLLLSAFSASAQLNFNEIPIMPGIPHSYPRQMTEINGTIYFQASRTGEGTELWTTNGTTAGTKFIKDLLPGYNDSNPESFTPHNGKVYFLTIPVGTVASLWETDGTTAGTTLIKQGFYTHTYSETNLITVLNGKMLFPAGDYTTGTELWVSDGTTAGTTMLKDIAPGNESSLPTGMVTFNGKLYFAAGATASTQELWCTDGTAAGTVMVSNINSTQKAFIRDLCVINNSLYFTATNATGRAVYKSDGTSAGTVLVTTFNSNTTPQPGLTRFTVFDNKLFFMTENTTGSTGNDLWVTDGTASGTIMLRAATNTTYTFDIFIAYNNKLHFCGLDNKTAVLYSTDGTVNGTYPADGFDAATYKLSTITGFAVYNGSLYFSGYSSLYGTNYLFAFNTTTGLSNVRPIGTDVRVPIPSTLYYDNKLVYNNKLYLTASFNSNEGYELWSIDGTPTAISNTAAKAAQVFSLYPNPATNVLHLTMANTYKHASITLTNAIGQIVLTENITDKNTVSLQGIAPGIYNATIDADGIRETQKLIIQ